MKVRNDFVTNSSSSSFILAFKSRDEALREIAEMDCDTVYKGVLLGDVQSAEEFPISKENEELMEMMHEEAYVGYMYGNGFENKPINSWLKAHPGMDRGDFFDSEEYKRNITEGTEEEFQELKNDVGDAGFVVMVEYEDHNPIGSKLEHEIMPYAPFTVRWISNH